MLSTAYFHPLGGVDGPATSLLDQRVWMVSELFFEGSMRALFSMLFGAGVILFTTSKSGELHYRRTFWLFVFGLFDGYVLQWSGDILVVYALAGALLYFGRHASSRRLLVLAGLLLLLLFMLRWVVNYGLGNAQAAHERVVAAQLAAQAPAVDDAALALDWADFAADAILSAEEQTAELTARRTSYFTAFRWNQAQFNETLLFVLPTFMLWDALVMMLIGMALYKAGVLQGERSDRFYLLLAASGIGMGLLVNSVELEHSIASNYDVLVSYSFLQPTYDSGRIGLGLGYMALLVWWVRRGYAPALQRRLAAVGRMALTNYLMHSLIALLVFSGAGLGLVGQFDRWQLYLIVFGIWGLQLWFSLWWLERYSQGPMEALWRRLTYGGVSA